MPITATGVTDTSLTSVFLILATRQTDAEAGARASERGAPASI